MSRFAILYGERFITVTGTTASRSQPWPVSQTVATKHKMADTPTQTN